MSDRLAAAISAAPIPTAIGLALLAVTVAGAVGYLLLRAVKRWGR